MFDDWREIRRVASFQPDYLQMLTGRAAAGCAAFVSARHGGRGRD